MPFWIEVMETGRGARVNGCRKTLRKCRESSKSAHLQPDRLERSTRAAFRSVEAVDGVSPPMGSSLDFLAVFSSQK
jgi:hypothetical protein